jgi:hypothetical protein
MYLTSFERRKSLTLFFRLFGECQHRLFRSSLANFSAAFAVYAQPNFYEVLYQHVRVISLIVKTVTTDCENNSEQKTFGPLYAKSAPKFAEKQRRNFTKQILSISLKNGYPHYTHDEIRCFA